MSDHKLKPCPFCGGEAIAYSLNLESFVTCRECRVTLVKKYDSAIIAWNTRFTGKGEV
jgi:hypothetical protein